MNKYLVLLGIVIILLFVSYIIIAPNRSNFTSKSEARPRPDHLQPGKVHISENGERYEVDPDTFVTYRCNDSELENGKKVTWMNEFAMLEKHCPESAERLKATFNR